MYKLVVVARNILQDFCIIKKRRGVIRLVIVATITDRNPARRLPPTGLLKYYITKQTASNE